MSSNAPEQKRRFYSEEEVTYILENYGKQTSDQVAKALGRTGNAIRLWVSTYQKKKRLASNYRHC